MVWYHAIELPYVKQDKYLYHNPPAKLLPAWLAEFLSVIFVCAALCRANYIKRGKRCSTELYRARN